MKSVAHSLQQIRKWFGEKTAGVGRRAISSFKGSCQHALANAYIACVQTSRGLSFTGRLV